MSVFSFNATWQAPMERAISNWNSRPTTVFFEQLSISNNTITAGSRVYTWYGLHTAWHRAGIITRFTIDMNSRTISQDATNFSNFVTSVFAHELGHSIWLADNPAGTTANGSIMNHNRNRNTLTTPTAFDVASVNIMFGSTAFNEGSANIIPNWVILKSEEGYHD